MPLRECTVIVASLALASACAGSTKGQAEPSSASQGTVSAVTGSIAGAPFTAKSSAIVRGRLNRNGHMAIMNIAISDSPTVCQGLAGEGSPQSMLLVAFHVSDIGPGSYVVPTKSADLRTFVGVELKRGGTTTTALSGVIDLVTVDPKRVTGRLKVSFADGTIEGSFDARPCAAD